MNLASRESIPFMSKSNYRHEFQHLLLWGFVVSVLEGNFASIVMETIFNGGETLVWLASCTQLVMFLTSIFWGTLCAGRRKIALMTFAISGVCLLVATIGLVPKTPTGAICFVVQIAAAQFFLTGVVTIRSAVWKANYPTSDRGNITSRFQMIRTIVSILSLVVVSRLFDWSPGAIRWVYPLIAVTGAISLIPFRKIRIRGEEQQFAASAKNHPGTKNDLAIVHPLDALNPYLMIKRAIYVFSNDREFLFYCSSLMCTGIGNLLVRTVTVIIVARIMVGYFEHGQGVYISTVLLEVIAKLLMLGFLRSMGKLFDRIGILQIRVINSFCWVLGTILGTIGTILIVYMDAIGPYALVIAICVFGLRAVFLGLAASTGAFAWNLGHLHFAEPDKAELYMGIHVSLTGLRGILMPGIGILLWHWIGWPVWIIAILFSVSGFLGYLALARKENQKA